MAIKTRFVMPMEAFQAMRSLGYAGSVDMMFTQFAVKHGVTDSILKHKAMAEGTTVTEAVRRTLVASHPELQYTWPAKQTVPKPHQPVKPDLSDERKAVVQACRVIAALLLDPDDGRARYHAREFLAKNKD
jgi:hypothetical protein